MGDTASWGAERDYEERLAREAELKKHPAYHFGREQQRHDTFQALRAQRRFEAAKAALQGMLACSPYCWEERTKQAVQIADLLLAELEKDK